MIYTVLYIRRQKVLADSHVKKIQALADSHVEKVQALADSQAELFVVELVPTCIIILYVTCLLYTSPSPRDATLSRMPSSA